MAVDRPRARPWGPRNGGRPATRTSPTWWTGPGPARPLSHAVDLLAHMRRARAGAEREEAAHLVRVLLREADADPFATRLLLQPLIPGHGHVAARLRWGRVAMARREAFFGEPLPPPGRCCGRSGQHRPYAVLDLLSATRCRLRRHLFRSEHLSGVPSGGCDGWTSRRAPAPRPTSSSCPHPDDLRHHGMRAEELEVLYAHHVLGYSIAELAAAPPPSDRRPTYAPTKAT